MGYINAPHFIKWRHIANILFLERDNVEYMNTKFSFIF